jgi:hypothetical protein
MRLEELTCFPVTCHLCRRRCFHHPYGAAGLAIAADRTVALSDDRPYVFCDRCWANHSQAAENALSLARKFLPAHGRRPTDLQLQAAYDAALGEGEKLEQATALFSPRRRGRPRALAKDFALQILFFLGIPDARLAELVGKSPQHIKHRRQRSDLHASVEIRNGFPANFGTPFRLEAVTTQATSCASAGAAPARRRRNATAPRARRQPPARNSQPQQPPAAPQPSPQPSARPPLRPATPLA